MQALPYAALELVAHLPRPGRHVSVILLNVIMRVSGVLVMCCMMMMPAGVVWAGNARLVRIAFVAAMGNAVVARHQVQLHRGDHAGRAGLAQRTIGGLIELLHGPL